MKKLFTIASLFLLSLSANAEGYQVNLQSARQAGMGHVGAALKLGSESMFYNPAGLSFMESKFDISLGGSAVFSNIDYNTSSTSASTDNSASTPIYLYASYKISDKFAAGVSVTTPYGSSLNWGKSWIGSDLVQDISLQSFSIQPTLSYRITDKFSIGGGLMINFGDVSISRALLPVGYLSSFLGSDYASIVPVSTTLTGDAATKLGFNIGAMYDVTDRLTIGASYRSKVDLVVSDGTAQIDYASDLVESMISSSIPPLDNGTFAASMPMCANLNVGAAYQMTNKFILSAEIQTVFWSAYDRLDIAFSEEVGNYTISAEKNYKNTIIARLGGEYNVTDRFDLRAGVYFDQSPVLSDNYSPETPGMNKLGFSAGFSYRPLEFMSIDFSMLYIEGIAREGSIEYTNGLGVNSLFSGTYDSSAFAPSLGLSFRF